MRRAPPGRAGSRRPGRRRRDSRAAARPRQRSNACGQRGAKRQPTGMASSRGGEPGMPRSGRSGWATSGNDCSSCWVYGMLRVAEERGRVVLLGHDAAVHDHDAVAHLCHDAEVMGDEDDRHPEVPRDAAEQLQDLRLDHHVEGGRRLVGDDDVRVAGERERDHGALPHAAGVGVRILARPPAANADPFEQLGRALRAPRPSSCPASAGGSPPRSGPPPSAPGSARSWRPGRRATGASSGTIAGPGRRGRAGPRRRTRREPCDDLPPGGSRRSMPSTVVVLPQPDSPTRPSVSPRRRSKLTPSTARSGPLAVELDRQVADPEDRRGLVRRARRVDLDGTARSPVRATSAPGRLEVMPLQAWVERVLEGGAEQGGRRARPTRSRSPGGRSAHHAPAETAPRSKAKFSIWPQLMTVGSPRPRKARVDSARIARLMTRTMLASMSGRTAGRMWRRRMWMSPAPTALARMTNFRSRTDSVCARTSRAVVVQPRMPMTRMMVRKRWPEDRDEHDHAGPGPGSRGRSR